MPRTPLQRTLIGPAGEHYVLSQLYQQGILAALAPPGTPVIDILVLSPDAESVAVTIQVKTSVTGRGWPMNQRHEDIAEDRMLYALVDFSASPPVTYLLPSATVADVLRESHRAWLSGVGRGGHQRKDTPMRQVKRAYAFDVPGYPDGWLDDWAERWDLIVAEIGASGDG